GRYHVHVAENGEKGVACAARVKPDLILMDIVMPTMNGLEACRELRTRRSTRAIPVILVTSQSDEIDREEGFRSGCTDYINKPVDELELLMKVESWLDESFSTEGKE